MTIYPQPLSGKDIPRFGEISTFMRLPIERDLSKLDIAMVGIPWDGGTTNRPGARHGPRAIRDMSTLMRLQHPVSKIRPYDLARCGDHGDAPVNPVDLLDTLDRITSFYNEIYKSGTRPLTAGGDHLITLPIMRAIAKDYKIGMVHFDAHSDTGDTYFNGSKYAHGTPFRRAIEEGLLDPNRTIQIGIRGSQYDSNELSWAKDQGIRIITIDEYYEMGIKTVIDTVHEVVGTGPTYCSFDVDGLDPVYAPGTGTPEIGGFTTYEAQYMIRGLQGLNIIGGDVVEVAPMYDPTGNTALVGATMMWEILCIMADSISTIYKNAI